MLITEEGYKTLVRRASRSARHSQYAMDTQLMMPLVIDEVSLLFREAQELDAFCRWAGHDPLMSHFNTVEHDEMIRLGVQEEGTEQESFGVRFEFFRLRGCQWRIEAMHVLGGTAPLHAKAIEDFGTGCVVHASYKKDNAEAYELERARLTTDRFTEHAEYANSYGMFSYWTAPELGHVYLKPRVNLRDS